MISKQKKVLYGAALAISSGLFANEVVNATQREEPPEPIERPAEAEWNESAAPQATPTPTTPASTTDAGTGDATARHEAPLQTDPLAALEAALSKLGGEDASKADEGDTEAPRPRRKRPQPESSTANEETPLPTPRISATARAERRERLDGLFEKEPLSGVVSGPNGTLALVGGRTVRAGDLLGDGESRVLECTAAGLRVDFEGEPAWIPLPGLRAQTKTAPTQGAAAAATPAPVARNVSQETGTGASPAVASGSQGGQP